MLSTFGSDSHASITVHVQHAEQNYNSEDVDYNIPTPSKIFSVHRRCQLDLGVKELVLPRIITLNSNITNLKHKTSD